MGREHLKAGGGTGQAALQCRAPPSRIQTARGKWTAWQDLTCSSLSRTGEGEMQEESISLTQTLTETLGQG